MRFRGALLRIFKQVLTADPRLDPVYLIKVDFAAAYMRLWVRVEDVLSVTFLIPKKTPATQSWWDYTSLSPSVTLTVLRLWLSNSKIICCLDNT